MPFGFSRDASGDRIDRIEATLQRMFADDRHAFDLAMSALVGGADPHTVGGELRATDHRVNEAEREIRRELVVHASVSGGIDTPAILVYMSIVKDIERVGDYAKNLFDLARDGAQLGEGAAGRRLLEIRDQVSRTIADTADCFGARDAERARTLLADGDAMLDSFDATVTGLVKGRDTEGHVVARALAERYLKRIVAHLMNALSAVVMPLDRLDYFDEDPEDR
ncbi:PhoU domain-containing protein [Nitriliruptoraceae bacterium ZYF776]|nr:PhoU domain-containing protein [Profundirhabdus halotolerans]